MSEEYQNMKLKQIMAIYGCDLRPSVRVGYLDVVAEDGKIVLHGTIDHLRKEMCMSKLAYGEPIMHPSARSFYDSPPIIRDNRKVKWETIQAEIDEERHLASKSQATADESLISSMNNVQIVDVDGDVSDDDGSDISAHVESPPTGFFLPENKIGALQEKYQSAGIFPKYTITRKRNITVYFICKVELGYLKCAARGNSKQEAKQMAAGNMLYMVADTDPFTPPQSGKDRPVPEGEMIVYNENYVPVGLEVIGVANVQAPPRARWANMGAGMAALPVPRLNRRERRAKANAARAITQAQINKWADEPLDMDKWLSIRKDGLSPEETCVTQ